VYMYVYTLVFIPLDCRRRGRASCATKRLPGFGGGHTDKNLIINPGLKLRGCFGFMHVDVSADVKPASQPVDCDTFCPERSFTPESLTSQNSHSRCKSPFYIGFLFPSSVLSTFYRCYIRACMHACLSHEGVSEYVRSCSEPRFAARVLTQPFIHPSIHTLEGITMQERTPQPLEL